MLFYRLNICKLESLSLLDVPTYIHVLSLISKPYLREALYQLVRIMPVRLLRQRTSSVLKPLAATHE